MQEVIILRHSSRGSDGRLSEAGIRACRELAPKIGMFDVVFASPAERTQQTANELTGVTPFVDSRALAFRLDESQQAKLEKIEASEGTSMEKLQAIWALPGMANELKKSGAALISLAHDTLNNLPANGRGLIVTHNLMMLAMEKLVEQQDFATIDHNVDPLQGFVLTKEGLRDFIITR